MERSLRPKRPSRLCQARLLEELPRRRVGGADEVGDGTRSGRSECRMPQGCHLDPPCHGATCDTWTHGALSNIWDLELLQTRGE